MTALQEEGYTTPTPIQQQGIPPALEGRDLLGIAQTGTGKTAAFALPILDRLFREPRDRSARGPALPRALILAPTRELATQITESFTAYGRHTGLRHTAIFGGVSQMHQERALRAGVDIVVATPGRLLDLMEQRIINLSRISVLVLDEADRMLDMGFIKPIRQIAAALPTARQTMLFSATMPKAIAELAHALLKHPVRIEVTPQSSPVESIEQSVFMVTRERKQPLLERLLELEGVRRAVVFTKTKHGADRVMKRLVRAGVTAQAIHGNKAQNQRIRALDAFRHGKSRVLVATDVAARGLDVDGITHVFNYDLPMEPEAYVHRIGRTGRAGNSGIAMTFCDPQERDLLRDVERLIGRRLPIVPVPTDLPAPEPRSAFNDYADRSDRPDRGHRGGPPRSGGHGHGQSRGTGHGHGHSQGHGGGPSHSRGHAPSHAASHASPTGGHARPHREHDHPAPASGRAGMVAEPRPAHGGSSAQRPIVRTPSRGPMSWSKRSRGGR